MIQKHRQVIELIKQTFNTKPKNRRFAIFNTHLNRTTLQGAFTSLPKSVGAAFSKGQWRGGRSKLRRVWHLGKDLISSCLLILPLSVPLICFLLLRNCLFIMLWAVLVLGYFCLRSCLGFCTSIFNAFQLDACIFLVVCQCVYLCFRGFLLRTQTGCIP